jgi:hypothetical protein
MVFKIRNKGFNTTAAALNPRVHPAKKTKIHWLMITPVDFTRSVTPVWFLPSWALTDDQLIARQALLVGQTPQQWDGSGAPGDSRPVMVWVTGGGMTP